MLNSYNPEIEQKPLRCKRQEKKSGLNDPYQLLAQSQEFFKSCPFNFLTFNFQLSTFQNCINILLKKKPEILFATTAG